MRSEKDFAPNDGTSNHVIGPLQSSHPVLNLWQSPHQVANRICVEKVDHSWLLRRPLVESALIADRQPCGGNRGFEVVNRKNLPIACHEGSWPKRRNYAARNEWRGMKLTISTVPDTVEAVR